MTATRLSSSFQLAPWRRPRYATGTRHLGVNGAIDDKGRPVEQLFSDKNQDSGFKNPSTWGILELSN